MSKTVVEPFHPQEVFDLITKGLGPRFYEDGDSISDRLSSVSMADTSDDLEIPPRDKRLWTYKNGFLWIYLIVSKECFAWGFAGSKAAASRKANAT